jgi:DNA-binding PadR family transcriptional regulator
MNMTDAELAILSLLAEGPSYDHELHTTIEARGLRKWTAIGSSSMYYVLDKLEKQGLIEQVADERLDGKGPRRYRLSAAGTGVLQTSVSDLLSTPHAYDKSFELGLANLNVLKPSQVRSALQNRRQDMAMKLERLRDEREEVKKAGGIFQIDALFDHHISMMEAEMVWLDEFTVAWEAQAPTEQETYVEPTIVPRIKQVILPQDPDSIHKQRTRESPPQSRHTPPTMRTMPPTNKPQEDDEK